MCDYSAKSLFKDKLYTHGCLYVEPRTMEWAQQVLDGTYDACDYNLGLPKPITSILVRRVDTSGLEGKLDVYNTELARTVTSVEFESCGVNPFKALHENLVCARLVHVTVSRCSGAVLDAVRAILRHHAYTLESLAWHRSGPMGDDVLSCEFMSLTRLSVMGENTLTSWPYAPNLDMIYLREIDTMPDEKHCTREKFMDKVTHIELVDCVAGIPVLDPDFHVRTLRLIYTDFGFETIPYVYLRHLELESVDDVVRLPGKFAESGLRVTVRGCEKLIRTETTFREDQIVDWKENQAAHFDYLTSPYIKRMRNYDNRPLQREFTLPCSSEPIHVTPVTTPESSSTPLPSSSQ